VNIRRSSADGIRDFVREDARLHLERFCRFILDRHLRSVAAFRFQFRIRRDDSIHVSVLPIPLRQRRCPKTSLTRNPYAPVLSRFPHQASTGTKLDATLIARPFNVRSPIRHQVGIAHKPVGLLPKIDPHACHSADLFRKPSIVQSIYARNPMLASCDCLTREGVLRKRVTVSRFSCGSTQVHPQVCS
jgi:hypothetical protein